MDSEKFNANKDRKPIGIGQVVKSIIILVITYCLLVAGWPVLGKGYSRLYRIGANLLYGRFGSSGVTKFNQSGDKLFDTDVTLFNLGRKDAAGRIEGVKLPCSSRRCGYVDAAFLASLIIATPVTLRRKLWALVWGQFLLHVLIFAKLGLWLADRFSREPLCLFAVSPFWTGKLRVFYELFVLNVTFGLVAAVFIWVLVTFRREDWSRMGFLSMARPVAERGDKSQPMAV